MDWTPRTFVSNPSENERVLEMTSPNKCSAQGFLLGGAVPLSEHEQRQLRQIEQALYRDDPKFGRRMRATDPRVRYERTLMQALLGVVIGAGLLPAGAVTHRVYLQAAGVVIVLLSLACGGRLAAVRGPGPARAFQGGEQDGEGHEASARAGQAGPGDGADGRALASSPGR